MGFWGVGHKKISAPNFIFIIIYIKKIIITFIVSKRRNKRVIRVRVLPLAGYDRFSIFF